MALFNTPQALQKVTKLRSKKAPPSVLLQENFEYKNFAAYEAAGGEFTLKNWIGQDAKWLKSDRENCTNRWKNAARRIIFEKIENRLLPFEQVADFYHYTQVLVKIKKHESQWIYGAYYLVNDLADAYDRNLTVDMFASIVDNVIWPIQLLRAASDNLKNLLAALNAAIANYAIRQFFRLLYGEFKNSPRRGIDAWKFDENFIITEQGVEALPVYSDPNYDLGLLLQNELFNKKGWFVGYGFNLAQSLSLIDAVFIPVYPDQYNSNLTIVPYGVEARILVPLAMLHPNKYFYNSDTINTKFGLIPIKERKFAKTLERGEAKPTFNNFFNRDREIYLSYINTNKRIKKTFYE